MRNIYWRMGCRL